MLGAMCVRFVMTLIITQTYINAGVRITVHTNTRAHINNVFDHTYIPQC